MRAGGDARWTKQIERLSTFRQRYGHVDVPIRFKAPDGTALGGWVVNQRLLYRKRQLPTERARTLAALGFDFQRRDSQWETFFAKLERFRSLHGHCDVPNRWPLDPRLGAWASRQRRAFREERLSGARRDRLEKAEFRFEPLEAAWEARVAELKAFRARHGHGRVGAEDTALSHWAKLVRERARKGKLPARRRRQLEELDFSFRAADARRQAFWEEMFGRLLRIKREVGHLRLAPRAVADRSLRSWIASQRHVHARGRLRADRLARLRQAGFPFNLRDDKWEAHLRQLRRFMRRHGAHVNPPRQGQSLLLVRWMDVQRTAKARGELPEARIRQLEAMGFVWSLKQARERGELTLTQLSEFKRQFGHLWLPCKHPRWRHAAEWARSARADWSAGRLAPELERRLRSLGLPLEPEEAQWERLFAATKDYVDRTGAPPEAATALSRWLDEQSALSQRGELELDRERRLSTLGVVRLGAEGPRSAVG